MEKRDIRAEISLKQTAFSNKILMVFMMNGLTVINILHEITSVNNISRPASAIVRPPINPNIIPSSFQLDSS